MISLYILLNLGSYFAIAALLVAVAYILVTPEQKEKIKKFIDGEEEIV